MSYAKYLYLTISKHDFIKNVCPWPSKDLIWKYKVCMFIMLWTVYRHISVPTISYYHVIKDFIASNIWLLHYTQELFLIQKRSNVTMWSLHLATLLTVYSHIMLTSYYWILMSGSWYLATIYRKAKSRLTRVYCYFITITAESRRVLARKGLLHVLFIRLPT